MEAKIGAWRTRRNNIKILINEAKERGALIRNNAYSKGMYHHLIESVKRTEEAWKIIEEMDKLQIKRDGATYVKLLGAMNSDRTLKDIDEVTPNKSNTFTDLPSHQSNAKGRIRSFSYHSESFDRRCQIETRKSDKDNSYVSYHFSQQRKLNRREYNSFLGIL